MGIKLFSDSAPAEPPNPNPSQFKIISVKSMGKYSIAEIEYLGVTTFEGRKILLLENTEKEIRSQKTIDPHFTDTGPLKIIARFRPDHQGRSSADISMKVLHHIDMNKV